MKIIELEQGSDAWKEFRKKKIGASDIPTICGVVGAYNTRSKLLSEKLGAAPQEQSDYLKDLFASGHEWEIKVRDSVNEMTGLGFKPIVVQCESNAQFFASLDGLSADKTTCLEVKSTKKKEYLALIGRQICPPVWMYQMQWQMFISETDKSILAVVNSETGAVVVNEYARDLSLIDFILDHANHFLREMNDSFPEVKHEITLLQDEAMKYISDSKRVIKEYQALIDEEEMKIKKMSEELLSDFNFTKIEAYGISVEWQERKGSVDYSAVKELEGVDLEKYRKKPTRFIKIVELKNRKQIEKETT